MSATQPFSTVWCDGRILPADRATVGPRDSAFLDGVGCYTTVSCENGVPRWPERHARRLTRDARAIGLGTLALERAHEAIRDAARATLPDTTGALRLQCSRADDTALCLTGMARSLGDDPPAWRALSATSPHWGPMPWGGAKITSHWPAALARRETRGRGVDEALLFDRDDRLIEGSRSNLVIELASGELVTPDLARGGVEGIARSVLLERFEAERGRRIAVRDVERSELANASALIAINALRPGRRIAQLDGRPFGDARADRLAREIERVLAAAQDLEPGEAGPGEAACSR